MMRIHNLLEEVVIEKIDEILGELRKQKAKEKLALAAEYKLDIACYVLNRLDPVYIVSGRGLAYLDIDYIDKLQRDADLVTLIHQGIERITSVQRPHYKDRREQKSGATEGSFFNFPIIRGRIFSSVDFSPVFGLPVELLSRREPVMMIEKTWQNPYQIVENTPGNFYFWPKPEPAERPGETGQREFEIVVRAEGFEEMRHFFIIELEAEEGVIDYFRVNKIFTLKDLYLVPKE